MVNKVAGVILICVLGGAGCGSGAKVDNSAGRNANNTPASASTPVASPTQQARPVAITGGERIERPRVIEFADSKIPEGWQWIDPSQGDGPTAYESKAGRFKMTIGNGRDMYADNRRAPRLVKAITGDFQIETRVRFDPKLDYQGAGLLIYAGGNDYMRFERGFGGLNDGGSGIRLDVCESGNYAAITTPGEIPTEAVEVDLRIVRRGKIFTAFWRLDENSEWREAEEFESEFPETIMAGIIGCNTREPISVEFDRLRLLPQAAEKPF